MMNDCIENKVEIGISTRNRWNDLRITLSRIADFGLTNVRVMIIDDASDQCCPFDVSSIHPNAELKRFNECNGYINRRNQLIQATRTEYFLGLDDDSYPISGSLDAAVKFADSCNDLLCLCFPVFNPNYKRYELLSVNDKPYLVRSFIGCANLIRCRSFIEIGGYREELIHQGEEVDISARAFLKGLHRYHFPYLQVYHTATNSWRNWYRMDYYGARNAVLWNDWYIPRDIIFIKQFRGFLARVLQVKRTGRLGHIKGYIDGIRDISKYKSYRKSMSMTIYKDWERLPPR